MLLAVVRCYLVAVIGVALLASSAAVALAGDQVSGDPRSPGPVFMLEKGRFTAFDPPGVNANELIDLNTRGQVAGTYVDEDGASHGFSRDWRGRFTLLNAPGAVETYVFKVNNRGQIIGNACNTARCHSPHGYLRDPNGRYTSIQVPGAIATQATGLDDRGRVVGDYLDKDNIRHGYLWDRGRIRTIDIPGASSSQLTAINSLGQMLGVFVDAQGNPHGFYRSPHGHITTIDAPGAQYTLPLDLNNHSRIVGFTTDALPLPTATQVHGFVLNSGPDGPLTQINVPGAPQTVASGIDDRGRITGIYDNRT